MHHGTRRAFDADRLRKRTDTQRRNQIGRDATGRTLDGDTLPLDLCVAGIEALEAAEREAEREDRGVNDGEPVADSDFGDVDFDGDGDGGDLMTADRLLESDGGPGADSPLDVDFAAETFHHDSAADGGPGLDGSLGLDGASSGGSFDDDGTDFDSFAAEGLSLHDHLIAQAGTAFMGTDLLIASHIIDQIDEAGYLPVRLLDITNRLEIPLARGEDILRIIQTFEPTGVGARTLAECLALQAKDADRYDPAMARLIDNLDLVAKGAFDLGKLQDEEEKKAAEDAAETFKPVLAKLKEALKDKAEDVRVTSRLVDSPACLVVTDDGMSMQLARMLKQAGQSAPEVKPVLEVNPEHALVKKLDGSVHFHDLAHILFDQALLAEGGLPADPAAYVKRVNALLV